MQRYFHQRIVEAQHVDHVWIAENSIFVQEAIMTQTRVCDPHKTCKKPYSKNITASSKSASSFPMRTWIGPFGLGSIQSERKIKSRQSQTLRLFHWKGQRSVPYWMGSVAFVLPLPRCRICFSFVSIRTIILGSANWISDWGYEFRGLISLQQCINCFQ